IQAAYFDGSQLKPTPISTAVTFNALEDFHVVRPNLLVGVASKAAGQVSFPTIAYIDLSKASPTVVFPTAPNGSTIGFLVAGVRGRNGDGQNFAVSDDQLKAIYLTSESITDPVFTNQFTIWMLDLVTGNAGSLYSSPTLQGALQRIDAAPQFVHTAAA